MKKQTGVISFLTVLCFLLVIWLPCHATDDSVYVCKNNKTGTPRLVNSPNKCNAKTEHLVTLIPATQGPQGAQGPLGPQGPEGSCACENLNNGLVAYYPFNGNANDESGNGYNGVVNGATLTADRFGNPNSAYNFDGPSGNTITTSLVPSNIFTISLWYKASATQLQNAGIASTYSTTLYNGFYYPHGGTWEAIRSDGNAIHTMPHPDVDNWINLVIVSDGTQIRVYKNSNLVLSFSGTTTHADTLILGSSRFNGKFFTGIIDDVRIYNRALSEFEIQQLFNL